MATEIRAPYNTFFGEDGYPLEGGFIYIGQDGLNPLSNPQQAYWDAALTIPAANIRTSAGRPSTNGVIGRLYVPGNYSILVQDKNGRTIYSQLSVTFEYSDLLVTESRETLTRSARAPNSFSLNDIIETGFYAWTNGATTNQPAPCAAGDVFELEVVSAPDGAGVVVQTLYDLTEGGFGGDTNFKFMRYSSDGGTSWSAWSDEDTAPQFITITADRTFSAAEFTRDTILYINNAGSITVDMGNGASRNGIRVTCMQVGAGAASIVYSGSRYATLVQYTVMELISQGNAWWCPAFNHGRAVFGPGALAATDWIVPPGIHRIRVTGVGQGGNGAAGSSGSRGGGGGGSGAWCRDLVLPVLEGGTVIVTLSTTGTSYLTGGGTALALNFGKGSNGSAATGGAGGTGSGGPSNGYAGGAGITGANYQGGGGGGVGGVGSNGAAAVQGAGGGSGGAASGNVGGVAGLGPYLNGVGGAAGQPGGVGAGGSSSGSSATASGNGGYGGGGAGGSGLSGSGAAGSGGAPFIVIEW